MAQLSQVCLDCGKVEVQTRGAEEDRTIHGLCDECYQRLDKQDPELARWAFKSGGGPQSQEERGG